MKCNNCENQAVITLQHASLCKTHFINYFENKVFKTIKKYQLLQPNDNVCIAASGGKDSLTALYLTKKYIQKYKLPIQIFALVIDEGIKNYRENTIKDLKQFCKEHKILLKQVSNKEEFNYTLDEAYPIVNKDTKKKPCNICGVWRRYLLNKHARLNKATKVVTGHNLDDEAQAIMMNMFKANTKLAANLGPISGIKQDKKFVQRVKPLYFCSEKETRLYTLLKKFQVDFTECPFSSIGYRANIRNLINDFEHKYKGTKQGIVKSFLAMQPHIKPTKYSPINECTKCKEPANKDICNACKIVEVLANA